MTARSVRVNGETRRVPPGTSLAALVGEMAADTREGIAAAVNGEIVPRERWQARELEDGDDIEIVRAVQGG